MNPNNDVILRVNGLTHGGWKSVRITASLRACAREFVVEYTEAWPDDPAAQASAVDTAIAATGRINRGDKVEVYLGDDLVLTGHVDSTPVEYDATGYSRSVQGRSLTADLVDAAADNPKGQWQNVAPAQIIRELAGQYGVAVRTEGATGAALPDHQIEPGESVYASMERIAQARQFLVTDDAAGTLVLATPGGAGRATSALEFGVNILAGAAALDYAEVFSEYVVRGQKSGTDELFGEAVNQGEGKAADHTIKRRRILIIRQQGQADGGTCQERADYEARYRAAKARETRYTVAEWRQEDGTLWRPNLLVTVRDPWIGHDGELLIQEVNYLLDRDGRRAEIVVIPPDGLLSSPEAAKKKKDAGLPEGVTWMQFDGTADAQGQKAEKPTWVDLGGNQ